MRGPKAPLGALAVMNDELVAGVVKSGLEAASAALELLGAQQDVHMREAAHGLATSFADGLYAALCFVPRLHADDVDLVEALEKWLP